MLDQALRDARESDSVNGETMANILLVQAELHDHIGEGQRALELVVRAEAQFATVDSGSDLWVLECRRTRATILAGLGRFAEALELLEELEGKYLARGTPFRTRYIATAYVRAQLHRERGQRKRAFEALDAALGAAQDIEYPRYMLGLIRSYRVKVAWEEPGRAAAARADARRAYEELMDAPPRWKERATQFGAWARSVGIELPEQGSRVEASGRNSGV